MDIMNIWTCGTFDTLRLLSALSKFNSSTFAIEAENSAQSNISNTFNPGVSINETRVLVLTQPQVCSDQIIVCF